MVSNRTGWRGWWDWFTGAAIHTRKEYIIVRYYLHPSIENRVCIAIDRCQLIDAIRNSIQAKRDALLHLHGYGIGVDGFNLTDFANEHIGAAAR